MAKVDEVSPSASGAVAGEGIDVSDRSDVFSRRRRAWSRVCSTVGMAAAKQPPIPVEKRRSATEPVEEDQGYGESHGYGPSHGGPSGPGDAPASADPTVPAKPPPDPSEDPDDDAPLP